MEHAMHEVLGMESTMNPNTHSLETLLEREIKAQRKNWFFMGFLLAAITIVVVAVVVTL